MKKIFILFLILVITIGCNKKEEKNELKEKFKYYKEENIERYNQYKQKNNKLKDEDIITRVNLNLDKPFYTDIKETKFINTNYILVNKYLYLKDTYIPDNLSVINKEYTNGNKQLVYEAKIALEGMLESAKSKGYNIRVISSYRSFNYQKVLYDNYVLKDGKELADTYSARPGFSEHQTGLVIDVDNYETNYENFESTKEFNWMINNSYKYGFILRYPKDKENITGYKYESWHYRYVGTEIAKYIKKHNITFDEYYVRFINY